LISWIQNDEPIAHLQEQQKKKRFFERITSLLGGERTPQSVALRSGWMRGWVLLKLFFSFQMTMTLQKNKKNEFMFTIIVFQKSGLPN
jgi:hypothetical protein